MMGPTCNEWLRLCTGVLNNDIKISNFTFLCRFTHLGVGVGVVRGGRRYIYFWGRPTSWRDLDLLPEPHENSSIFIYSKKSYNHSKNP